MENEEAVITARPDEEEDPKTATPARDGFHDGAAPLEESDVPLLGDSASRFQDEGLPQQQLKRTFQQDDEEALETFQDEEDARPPPKSKMSDNVPPDTKPRSYPSAGAAPPATAKDELPAGSTKEKKKKKKKKAPEKNALFKDVDETGRWGKISRTEIIVVGLAFLFVVAVIIGIVIFFVASGDDNDDSNSAPTPTVAPRTPAPSAAPPDTRPELQYAAILEALQNNTFVTTTPLDDFTIPDLEGLAGDSSQAPVVRAMSWMLYEDKLDLPETDAWLVPRYTAVMLYYFWNGPHWTGPTTNWLTRADTCDWEGVNCDVFQNFIEELYLNDYNLTGTIPPEINMLQTPNSLVLSSNNLGGTIPYLALGSLPRLTVLFLNDNQLEGSISNANDLLASGTLGTLMIQQNNIDGRWPFCPRSGQDDIFADFGLDCEDISCRSTCCIPTEHCY